ncbi:MAG: TetR/AcrR family transcriptional regulator [Anaerolineaceae bacterium]|nr:TetR/AcrR family transcriptional regulator [Anaerolineaceae bacterium]
MILKGNEDLRVVKTIESIKSAFDELICEKDYEKITVKELCDRVRINKKTFYHYYETLDYLLAEMQTELSSSYIERIKDYSLPEDLDKVNREFFLYSAEQGLAYEKITCSVTYHTIRNDMVENVNTVGWSKSAKYQKLFDYEKKLLMGFINNAVLNAYRQWVEDGKKLPLEEVIELTNRLVLGGVNGFFN